MKRKILISAIIIVALVVVGMLVRRSLTGGSSSAGRDGGRGARGQASFPVATAKVELQSLVYAITAVGSVEAYETIQVTSRVAGAIDRVLFTEGAVVGVGTMLVEIETERYRLAVATAHAAREKAAANAADLENGAQRREAALQSGLISRDEAESWRVKAQVAQSDLAQAQAALDQANLNLRDAYVRAPRAGTIQTRPVQTGQYVAVGTVLATIARRDPLQLRFTVPAREANQLRPGLLARFAVRDDVRPYSAKIVYVAAAADAQSRMVEVMAEVNNPESGAVRPGAFAEVTIAVGDSRAVPVVPLLAVRPSERGFLAYVVDNDKAVERIVTLGMTTTDGRVEIKSGLNPGEQLVIRGGEALSDGSPVKVDGAVAAGAPAR